MSSIFAFWASLLLGATGPVTGVSITPTAGSTVVAIAVNGDVTFRDFTMEGPYRLIVDVLNARHQLPQDDYLGIDRGGVRAIRTSQYSTDVVRVVLELDAARDYEVVREPDGLKVYLSGSRPLFQPWATPTLESEAEAAPSLEEFFASRDLTSSGEVSSTESPAIPAPATVQEVQRINVTFVDTPIADVMLTFAEFSGRSIVAGASVTGLITAQIDDLPWDDALQTILMVNGFQATTLPSGIIRVDNLETLQQMEAFEPMTTRAYQINYATAQEVMDALQGVVGQQGGAGGGGAGAAGRQAGTITVNPSTNQVIVTDIQRIHGQVEEIIGQLDVRTRQVMIQAEIIFVNRTDLNEFGVTYDLKDSQGNQLNVLTPGAVDSDGDGVIELPEEQVEVGTNVISLGGNSIAALGNANNRVAGPTLTLLSSLLLGRHTLMAFVEALESMNLSNVQASPSVTVADNRTARLQVGERTPIRVIDASAGGAEGAGGGGLPTASVQIEETGIILEATPHVTGNNILLDLHAERSAPQLAESDVGFIFQTQNADTRVLLEDGQTVVIAGLTVTEESEVRSGIPVLMDMPFVGRLFRVTRASQIQRDLIILVTPHIVN